MIVKNYEISKIDLKSYKIFLFYGKNDGHKSDSIQHLIGNNNNIHRYDEKEVLDKPNNFFENIFSGSLFENERIFIIKRASDKILKIIEEIISKKIENIIIIIDTDNLEKKSKLRSFFEKQKDIIISAFYPDNEQTLLRIAQNYLREKKISISPSNLNLIINKCNYERKNLINELHKIELYSQKKKNVTSDEILKLTNLIENHSIADLIDNCLIKNEKKTIAILNENNFSNDDCILITRVFLNKLKRILKLAIDFEINKNLDLTISTAKPAVFWKEKEIVTKQVKKLKPGAIKELIYKINELELTIKKGVNNSIYLVTDFILEQTIKS